MSTSKHISREHRTYWIETYGCQMNSAESNALEQALQQAGLEPAASPESADCAILNTCSVRKTAETRIWGRIGFFQHIKERNPLTLVITGCMAERLKDEFMQEAPAVDFVMGTNDKMRIAALLKGASSEDEEEYSFTQSYYKEGEVHSYVPIMNGCNNFCAYCIVPYVRGREISRDPESIFAEMQFLASKGVREVTLLGQNVNSYDYVAGGKHWNFSDLLAAIVEQSSSLKWLRFDSPHPKDFSPELIELASKEEKIAKHLHIPLQSGSNRILQSMNRKYDSERFLELIAQLRQGNSEFTFSTDVMVGFPGESEKDFQATLDVLREVRFLEAFMYYFNPREGTKAVSMSDQVPVKLRMERLAQLIALQREITAEEKNQRSTRCVEALVDQKSKRDENQWLAHTEHGEMVVFDHQPSITRGNFVTVQLHGLNGNTYQGSVI